MDPLTPLTPAPAAVPPSHLKLEIIAGVVLVLVVALGAFIFRGVLFSGEKQHIEFIGAATTTWYTLSGDTLTRVPTGSETKSTGPKGEVASAVLVPRIQSDVSVTSAERTWGILRTSSDGTKKSLGLGRPLGFLSDGSLLALTPLGLSRVTADGTTFQLINAGGTGSVTPIGVASPDLSLVAFENQTTRSIVLYRPDPSGGYTFFASAPMPRGILPASPETSATTSTQPVILPVPVFPRMVGIANNTLLVQGSDNNFYAFPILASGVGTSTPLRLIDAK